MYPPSRGCNRSVLFPSVVFVWESSSCESRYYFPALWQAKRSHRSPSHPTTRPNRTSAGKTALWTSVRWAARTTTALLVCLWPVRAEHITSAVCLTSLGLRVWNGHQQLLTKVTCLTGVKRHQTVFSLAMPFKFYFNSPFVYRMPILIIYQAFSPEVIRLRLTVTDWPPFHEEDPCWSGGVQCAGWGAGVPGPPCGGLCPLISCCAAQRPYRSSHHHQVIQALTESPAVWFLF